MPGLTGKPKRPKKIKAPEQDDKDIFIRRLAEYLVKDQSLKSIKLEMHDPAAHEWAYLRGATPLHGYPTVEEAEGHLRKWLLGR